MRSIKMNDLLLQLSKYDFYEWEQEDTNKFRLTVGLPINILSNLNLNNFYDSWGFEAVQNEFADPSFTIEKWLKLENLFFNWLQKMEDYLFPKGKVIATPNLERNWYLYDSLYPNWDNTNNWVKPDYEKYISLLFDSNAVLEGPSLRDEYRGVIIENYSEVRTLGKISVKGVPILFFSKGDMVITITEYLTVLIYYRNSMLLEQSRSQLVKFLDAQILEN